MNVCTFSDLKDEIVDCLRNKKLLPLLGSGFSKGAETRSNGKVPSGTEYKTIMLNKLKEESAFNCETLKKLSNDKFSKVCTFYEGCTKVTDEIKRKILKENFKGVLLKEPYTNFLKIDWSYIYTLNFDDAIENSSEFKEVVVANRKVYSQIFDEEKCVIKLHGDVSDYIKYKDGSLKVFTSEEYLSSLKKNDLLLTKLKHDWFYCNFIILGCSFDDELDLLSIQNVIPDDKKYLKVKRIFISDSEPDEYRRTELEQYNITDVIISKSYDDFYRDIYEAYIESKKTSPTDIFKYPNIKISEVQNDENEKYFYFGKNLYDNKHNEINIPAYFINREIKQKIVKNFKNNTIHLVCGNKISGRSYLLFDIYNDFYSSKKVFIFNGFSSLNEEAFNYLLKLKNSIVLFDINSITREQFKKLINFYDNIHQNETNIVVILGNNSSDFFGVLKLLIMENKLNDSAIQRYEISNKLSDKETYLINTKLSKLTIPNFSFKKTILDNLIIVADIMNKKSKFNSEVLKCNSEKVMTFLIIIAAKEKITSYDLIFFDIVQEAYLFISKYQMIFEVCDEFNFEKKASSNSQSKIVINSKYWLTRELGAFVDSIGSKELVINSYRYLVWQCVNKSNDKIDAAKKYKDFILFDVINNTFLQNTNTKRHDFAEFIMEIYGNLKDIVAEDYQYMHQYAKSCLHYSRTLKNNSDKLKYLQIALNNVKVSQSQVEVILENSRNENLSITLAHIQYTFATIYCDICKAENYVNKDNIFEAINSIDIALSSPYNNDDYRRDNNKSIGIKKFMDSFLANNLVEKLNKQQKSFWQEILNKTRLIITSNSNW